jgi:apolipoprotein N-acyltransferase
MSPRYSKILQAALIIALGAASGLSVTYASGALQIASLALFFFILVKSPTSASGFFRGWLFSFAALSYGLSWLYVSMHQYGGLPAPLAGAALAAFAAALSLFYGLAGGLLAALLPRAFREKKVWVVFIFCLPAFWTLATYARSALLSGFGWAAGAYAHVGGLLFGLAPFAGSLGIEYASAFLASLLAFAAFAAKDGRRLPAAGALALGILICVICSAAGKVSFGEPGEPVAFRLVQGGIGQDEKFSPMGTEASFLRYYKAVNDPALARNRIVVLPETIFPVPLDRLPKTLLADFLGSNRERSVPLIFGGFLRTQDGAIANGAVYADKNHRESVYLKRHLVPFGEFVPFGFRWLVEAMDIPMVDQKQGDPLQPTFDADGVHLAVSLCYEDLFPMEIRQWWLQKNAPGVLVNLSNLGWFGDTMALPQHLNISRMRAREFSRPMVRATNTGMTAAINQKGEVLAALPAMQPGVLDTEVVSWRGKPTPFARFGEIPTLFLLLLASFLGMILLFFRSKAPKSLE